MYNSPSLAHATGAGTGPAGPAAAGPMFTPSLRHDDVTLALTRGYIVWPIEMDSARDFAAERAGKQGPSFRIPVKFHPSKSFAFPARKFGSKGAEKRSFRAEWCAKYDWLHYDRVADAAFCLRSTMCQSRLNHVMLLSINREKVDQLDIDVIADRFVQGSEHRLRQFGKFATKA